METNESYEYIPSIPIHPFDIIKDEIEARGLTNKVFAESIGMKPSNFSRMMKTKGELTSTMALKLEASLGIPFSHWMKYQEEYHKDCARLKMVTSVENKNKKSSQFTDYTAYEDLYLKIASAIRSLKERMDKVSASGSLTIEQINSIESDFHRLGKELCEIRLS